MDAPEAFQRWPPSDRTCLKETLAVLLCVQPLPGETAIFNAPTAAPSGNKWAGNMLMFHVDFNMKWLKGVLLCSFTKS